MSRCTCAASLQKDPLFTRAGDDFIKRMTVLFERCVLTDEDGPVQSRFHISFRLPTTRFNLLTQVEYLCRNGESANAVYFLGTRAVFTLHSRVIPAHWPSR